MHFQKVYDYIAVLLCDGVMVTTFFFFFFLNLHCSRQTITLQVSALPWERLPWSWRWGKWLSRRETSASSKPAASFGTTPSPSEWVRTLRSSPRGRTTDTSRWPNKNLCLVGTLTRHMSLPPEGSECSVLIQALLWPRYSHWWRGRETNWCASRSERRRTAAGLTGWKTISCIWYGSEQHDSFSNTAVWAVTHAVFWKPLISLWFTGPVLRGRSLQAGIQEESERVKKRNEESVCDCRHHVCWIGHWKTQTWNNITIKVLGILLHGATSSGFSVRFWHVTTRWRQCLLRHIMEIGRLDYKNSTWPFCFLSGKLRRPVM